MASENGTILDMYSGTYFLGSQEPNLEAQPTMTFYCTLVLGMVTTISGAPRMAGLLMKLLRAGF